MSRRVDAAPEMAALARLFADETRAAICLALLDRRAWTAGELARYAGVARSTATEHLNLLTAAGVLVDERQGRHRYVRLADPQVAALVEVLSAHTPPGPRPATLRAATARSALARARTCYDHLAGALGVALADALADSGFLHRDRGWAVSNGGAGWLAGLGVDVEHLRRARRPMALACLDWTERRHHLAGGAGAALRSRFEALGWIAPTGIHRGIRVTGEGRDALARELGLTWPDG
ncbi:ArsR/SmtB family transcription factor [Phytoactinopolyspora limicola]|uniref:ArsR/SmtB family transcription factor n=1 Tax=Phytoactinopolyspora limicola TaxID=2715536 RepID=UPI0014076177|nr:winged helix-turn-helix domain-containing protein [Phytoactinopolyspora limicola]